MLHNIRVVPCCIFFPVTLLFMFIISLPKPSYWNVDSCPSYIPGSLESAWQRADPQKAVRM